MSEEKFMHDVEEFIKSHSLEGRRVFVEVESSEILETFNARFATAGRRCIQVALNPHTGEMKCIKYEGEK